MWQIIEVLSNVWQIIKSSRDGSHTISHQLAWDFHDAFLTKELPMTMAAVVISELNVASTMYGIRGEERTFTPVAMWIPRQSASCIQLSVAQSRQTPCNLCIQRGEKMNRIRNSVSHPSTSRPVYFLHVYRMKLSKRIVNGVEKLNRFDASRVPSVYPFIIHHAHDITERLPSHRLKNSIDFVVDTLESTMKLSASLLPIGEV